ncbi:hypothetical protein XENOCAPTIV_021709, partial [Xenoophorus captivus]
CVSCGSLSAFRREKPPNLIGCCRNWACVEVTALDLLCIFPEAVQGCCSCVTLSNLPELSLEVSVSRFLRRGWLHSRHPTGSCAVREFIVFLWMCPNSLPVSNNPGSVICGSIISCFSALPCSRVEVCLCFHSCSSSVECDKIRRNFNPCEENMRVFRRAAACHSKPSFSHVLVTAFLFAPWSIDSSFLSFRVQLSHEIPLKKRNVGKKLENVIFPLMITFRASQSIVVPTSPLSFSF